MPPNGTATPAAAAPGEAVPSPAPPPPAPAPAAGPPAPVGLSFNPAAANAATGSTFTVDVVVTGAQDLATVPLQITYDPKIMQLLNVSNGGFLSQDGQAVALVHRDDPASGTLQISAQRPPGTSGVNGSGSVFTLTFAAKGAGTGGIAVTRPALRNSASQLVPAMPATATVTVK